ncbi:aromatic ring-hydroxylating oxygenase subunit alpha [Oceanicola sp. S124]|uniref:aromatic ring-hydroxylating oxygenase subunit alpha n=1 Tax=Oceanicola sp. S124 TaxID=1042378 RepID=UPI0003097107|nr:aromatic ring-hydroxylating dioxygenase subunit alpha [Oceanicola sp. S124]
MSPQTQPDPFMRDQWYPVSALQDIAAGTPRVTKLFGQRVSYRREADGACSASTEDRALPVLQRYGCLWTSLGTPGELFEIPEYTEADRRNVAAGTVAVQVSAQRGIENFLDMGHFPYVHTGILGALPHTEVKEYNVEETPDGREIIATECLFYQPMASTVSTSGADVEYIYRVPHPTCSVLYKSSPLDEKRLDVIALFGQPTGEESFRGHMVLSILDDVNTDDFISYFQLHIFGQDKPILENQMPKRLPLDPRAETPIRADKTSIMYRRWLTRHGATYGVIPAQG